MKNIHKISTLAMVILLGLSLTLAACNSKDEGISDDWDATPGLQYEYDELTNSYVVVGYIGIEEDVYIPSTWMDLPVSRIASYAFDYSTYNVRYTDVHVPSSVYLIESYAFYYMPTQYSNIDTKIKLYFYAPHIYLQNYAIYHPCVREIYFFGDECNGNGFEDSRNIEVLLLPEAYNSRLTFSYLPSLERVYYHGTPKDGDRIGIYDLIPEWTTIYYFANNKKEADADRQYRYWTYGDDGMPKII